MDFVARSIASMSSHRHYILAEHCARLPQTASTITRQGLRLEAHIRTSALGCSLKNFELSCELGASKGCTELGIIYYEGTAAPKDSAKAAMLFDKGCKLGSDVSCQNYRMLTAKAQ